MARKKAKSINGNKANKDEMSLLNKLENFQPTIAGESVAIDGVRKRRQELEALVEPHLMTERSGIAVLFKGKLRYLQAESHESSREERLAWAAIRALQYLYKLEEAISAGDMDAAVRWAYDFSGMDFDVILIKLCGWKAQTGRALIELNYLVTKGRRQRHVEAGKQKVKFKTETQRQELLKAYEENRHLRNWLSATTKALDALRLFKTLDKSAVRAELVRLGMIT